MKGLLIFEDGQVQVIGQVKTITVFIPILQELLERLYTTEKEENNKVLELVEEDVLLKELERRKNIGVKK